MNPAQSINDALCGVQVQHMTKSVSYSHAQTAAELKANKQPPRTKCANISDVSNPLGIAELQVGARYF